MLPSRDCNLKLITTILLLISATCYGDQRVADIHLKDGGAYEIKGLISDYTVSLLIDTGASMSAISINLKNKLHISPYKHMYVLLADGRKVRVGVYHIPFVIISGCVVRNLDAVALHSNLNILGVSAMKLISPITIDMVNDRLIFHCN